MTRRGAPETLLPGPAAAALTKSMAQRVTRRRVDELLVERGLVPSRSKAQALVLAGRVWSRERRIDKPGQLLPVDAPLEVEQGPRFVSRGGEKLEGALGRPG